jgi:antitoxin component HigA of HigAB toxin-antitoxin module
MRNELLAEVAELQREFAAVAERQSKIVHLARRVAAVPEVEALMNEEKILTPAAVDAIRDRLESWPKSRDQAWLAREVGASAPHLSLMLNRKRECTADTARRLASALGLPVGLLLPPAYAAKAVAS